MQREQRHESQTQIEERATNVRLSSLDFVPPSIRGCRESLRLGETDVPRGLRRPVWNLT